ncbi:MAG: hypothetical protein ACO31E_01060 [Phycisphaerales bacterium]|jgi:membrane protein YdbS with pleckstrin-like domain
MDHSPPTSLHASPVVLLRRWRQVRAVHGLLVLSSSIAALILLLAGSDAAWIPAMVLTALLLLGAVLHIGWWHATHRAAEGLPPADREARVRAAGVRTIVHIVLSFVFGSMFLSFFALGLEHAAMVATVAFCALAVFGGPVWLAAVGDEEAEERQALEPARHTRRRTA